jgi:hypothetical protein
VCINEALASLIYTNWQVLKGGVSSLARPTSLSGWLEPPLFNLGADFSFCLLQLEFDQSAKGDLVNYNARHDQSTKGDWSNQ